MKRRTRAALAASVIAVIALAGCSAGGSDDLAKQWEESSDKGYISGDGSSLSIPPADRTSAVEFSGETDLGTTFGSADTRGSVTVVNFWYAGCAPCRAEAPDLEEAYQKFAPEGVKFLGVNTRDQVAQARQFAEQFGIEYPSIIDNADGRAVQRAFAGQVPLNAVPTTLVLDTEGRIAHRVLGQLADVAQLRTLIEETLAETSAGSAESGAGSAESGAGSAQSGS